MSNDVIFFLSKRTKRKKKMTTEQVKEVATTIRQQLGAEAFLLMGVKQNSFGMQDGKPCLTLNISKNPKKVTHVRISLDAGQDLYAVDTYCIRGTKTWKHLDTITGIYCESLKYIIERMTGLYLSFR